MGKDAKIWFKAFNTNFYNIDILDFVVAVFLARFVVAIADHVSGHSASDATHIAFMIGIMAFMSMSRKINGIHPRALLMSAAITFVFSFVFNLFGV